MLAMASRDRELFLIDSGATMSADSLITRDPNILNGTPVFKGTRVPVRTLFDYLSDGLSFEYFLETFPSVNRELPTQVLRLGHGHRWR